jgi:hypothetical protein
MDKVQKPSDSDYYMPSLAALPPGERAPHTHWVGGWVGPRVGLDEMEKWKFLSLSGLELRPLGHPACSRSLNQLHYPGSIIFTYILYIRLLAQDRDHYQALVNTVMNDRFHEGWGIVWVADRPLASWEGLCLKSFLKPVVLSYVSLLVLSWQ